MQILSLLTLLANGCFTSLVSAGGFQSSTTALVDTSDWQCEYCTFFKGTETTTRFTLANLSDDAFRYAHATGIEEGTSAFIDGQVIYFGESAEHFNLDYSHIGLDSAALHSTYGVYSQYQLSFDYLDLPIRQYKNLVTPFTNAGDKNLDLPAGWLFFNGNNPVAVNPSWSQLDLQRDWQQLKINWQHAIDESFDYQIKVHQVENSGIKAFSAAQIWNATYLPYPVKHKTQSLNAQLSYQLDDFRGTFFYQLSEFDNGIDSLTYPNPFDSLVSGSETAQIASEPDNKAYKVGLTLNYQLQENSWAKLTASTGRLTQDMPFSPYSTNPLLNTDLPQDTLGAKVDTTLLSLRVYSRLSPELSLKARYRYHDQDNQSEQRVYQPVIADSFIGESVTNLPYDYQSGKFSLGGDWRFLPGQLASVEFRTETRKRNFSKVEESDNEGLVGKLRLQHDSGIQLNTSISRFERDATQINMVDFLTVEENPLMQRYNQADRDEDKIKLQFLVNSWQPVSASLTAEYLDLEYTESEIGLQENRKVQYGVEFNWQVVEDINFALYLINEQSDIDLASSQGPNVSDWFASSNDTIDNVGLSLQLANLVDQQIDLSLEYNHADATSEINVNSSSANRMPTIKSDWTTAALKVDYHYSDEWRFQIGYQLDKFDSDDFAIDNVLPGTVSNLITFGAESYNYDVDYFSISFTYQAR